MAATRITSKKPYRLIQDDDCHWYLIPYDLQPQFERWVSELQQDDYVDFADHRINGPHTLKIYSWGEE